MRTSRALLAATAAGLIALTACGSGTAEPTPTPVGPTPVATTSAPTPASSTSANPSPSLSIPGETPSEAPANDWDGTFPDAVGDFKAMDDPKSHSSGDASSRRYENGDLMLVLLGTPASAVHATTTADVPGVLESYLNKVMPNSEWKTHEGVTCAPFTAETAKDYSGPKAFVCVGVSTKLVMMATVANVATGEMPDEAVAVAVGEEAWKDLNSR